MIVTLDAFSGRPNPSWRISDKDNARLLERVSGRALASAMETEVNVPLGPRGFIISAVSDDDVPEGVPQTFRVGSGVQKAAAESRGAVLSASENDEIAKFLLNTGRHVLEEDLMAFLASWGQKQAQPQAFEQGVFAEPAEPAPEEPAAEEASDMKSAVAAAACIIANTAYNPGFWNVPAVQPHNNCYNYAMNYRSDTFAQPGRISGHMYTAINCANVGTAANWDGCLTTCSGSNKNVALVIAPGPGFVDYHWYRRQKEGFWGHKPGGTAARNTDNRGRVINGTTLTPANCDRGPYTIFCGYRYSPTGMRVR
jgi:hypothetical protein